ncbi:MAG TPA: hypothetical protein VFP40_12835, partial [Terriglobales bacterium]|nr:hypothetical protein [Terriglobales bacterium]
MRAFLVITMVTTAFGMRLSAQPGGDRATPIKPGETCPPGTTEIRPRQCLGPQDPAPSILDYRPKSTLVVPEHFVRKAKYPAIDFHGHPFEMLGSVESLAKMGAQLDSINVRMIIVANDVSGDALKQMMATIRSSPTMKDRVRVLAGIDFRNVGPGWAQKAVAQLEADVAAGAVGIGEIPKNFGQTIRKADGSRLAIDDPDLDPIWQAAARLKLPVFIHTADPAEFYQPVDYHNERWL